MAVRQAGPKQRISPTKARRLALARRPSPASTRRRAGQAVRRFDATGRHSGWVPRSTPRRSQASVRQEKGYSNALRPLARVIPDAEWVGQVEVAESLGVSAARIGILIQGRLLVPAHNEAGQAGVTRESFDRQVERRKGHGGRGKARMFLADVARAVVGSI